MNKKSEELGELFGALAKAQGKIRGAVKDAKNPYFKSNYATLHECWNAIRDPLCENGLTIIQTIEEENGKLFLRSILGHSSGQYISSLMPILLAKQDPQSLGSATSYSRRYSLSALIGLSQMDDDGEMAMTGYRAKQKHDAIDLSDCERVTPYQNPSEPKTVPPLDCTNITLRDFKNKICDKFGGGFSLELLEDYLCTLERERSLTSYQIMEQALQPDMLGRFCNSYQKWYVKVNE